MPDEASEWPEAEEKRLGAPACRPGMTGTPPPNGVSTPSSIRQVHTLQTPRRGKKRQGNGRGRVSGQASGNGPRNSHHVFTHAVPARSGGGGAPQVAGTVPGTEPASHRPGTEEPRSEAEPSAILKLQVRAHSDRAKGINNSDFCV